MVFRQRRKEDDDENLDRWLLTYADLITLLLAFFIVMYSMSQLDSNKFGEMTTALSSVFKGPKLKPILAKDLSSQLVVNKLLHQGDLGILEEQIQEISSQLGFEDQLSTDFQSRGLIIHVSESAFFDLGKADLKSQARKALDLISVQLLKIPNHIRVEGHTDNVPINTPKYPSNWELSAARAAACLRYLIDMLKFPPQRISAVGYAEYRPITTNETAEGRAKNRRVDIVILDKELSYLEPDNLSGEGIENQADSIPAVPEDGRPRAAAGI
ncbi:MAG: OmpA family protein [candidate division Zixibacteria bacterium]|nr:OmpA family protein [candidate division Zixibacteria bacterium]